MIPCQKLSRLERRGAFYLDMIANISEQFSLRVAKQRSKAAAINSVL